MMADAMLGSAIALFLWFVARGLATKMTPSTMTTALRPLLLGGIV